MPAMVVLDHCRPIPGREFVEVYIKAYYLPETQLETWIYDHKVSRHMILWCQTFKTFLSSPLMLVDCRINFEFFNVIGIDLVVILLLHI